MRAHTRKHHTKVLQDNSSEAKKTSISAKDFYERTFGNFPRWAVFLAGLRYREGITQKQLGEVIGVKQSNISLMERGLRPIGKNIAQRLANVFNVDYRMFL